MRRNLKNGYSDIRRDDCDDSDNSFILKKGTVERE